MRDPGRSWLLPGAVALTGLLVAWAVLAASQTIAQGFRLSLYLLANVVFFLDFLDFVFRLYMRRVNGVDRATAGRSGTSVALDLGRYTTYQKRLHLRPYAVLVSVYNAEDSIDAFLEAMHEHRERCWIIDDGSTDQTVNRIRQAGWRCVEGGTNRKKPGAIRRLLESLPAEIETVMVVDPDITLSDSTTGGLSDLDTVVFEFQRSGMAALCPRIAIRPDGLLARFQALEYCMSFSLGRMSLADHGVNSGISVYRRNALAAALAEHSQSVYAEDFENSMILLAAGERIYYDSRLVITTQAPATLRAWFSQRVGWAFGLIKVYCERFPEIRRVSRRRASAAYQYLGYTGVACLACQPLKIGALILLAMSFAGAVDSLLGLGWLPTTGPTEPIYFLAAFAKYTLLVIAAACVAVPRGERAFIAPVLPLYFLYSVMQIVPNTIGYLNWLSLRIGGRRLFADHYQDEASLRRHHQAHPAPRRWGLASPATASQPPVAAGSRSAVAS